MYKSRTIFWKGRESEVETTASEWSRAVGREAFLSVLFYELPSPKVYKSLLQGEELKINPKLKAKRQIDRKFLVFSSVLFL